MNVWSPSYDQIRRGFDADWAQIGRGFWIAHGLCTNCMRIGRELDTDCKKGNYLLTKEGPMGFVPKLLAYRSEAAMKYDYRKGLEYLIWHKSFSSCSGFATNPSCALPSGTFKHNS